MEPLMSPLSSPRSKRPFRLTLTVLLPVALLTACNENLLAPPPGSMTGSQAMATLIGGTSTSCASIKAADPAATDGNFAIATTAGVAFTVYCHNMATSPAEYLTLPTQGA